MRNNLRATTMNDLPFPERPSLRFIDRRFRPDLWNLSKRYTLAILAHLGLAITFAIRSNECIHEGPNDVDRYLEHYMNLWFLISYFFIQIPAGIFSYKYSATRLFGICILGSSTVSFFTPIITKWYNPGIELAAFLQGIFQGAANPAFFSIWRYWAPPLERSTLVTLSYAGTFSGVVIGYQMSVTFCSILNWEYILFVYGILGLGWYFAWLWLVFEHPTQHPTISDDEVLYLQQTIDVTNEKPPIPWKQMLLSLPVCALLVASFSRAWFLESFQHSKYSQISLVKRLGFGIHIEYNNFLLSLSIPFAGFAADYMLQKTTISATKLRKIYISGGLLINAFCALLVMYTVYVHNFWLTGLETIFIMVMYAIPMAGFYANHLDIAGRYAGITMSVANIVSTLAAIIPLCFNLDFFHFIEDEMLSFILTMISVYIVGAVAYLIFGSADEQTWTKPIQNKEEEPRGFENLAAGNEWKSSEILVE